MKSLCRVLTLVVGMAGSFASQAGIVPLVDVALKLIEAIPNASPPVAGANASVGLNGGASVGTLGRHFSGAGSANAMVDIDRFRETSALATVSWEYVFMLMQPGITDIFVNYSYATSESVFTNFNANSRATAKVSGLEAFLDIAGLHQHLTWPDLTASGNCSSSGFFDDCGPSPRAFAAAADQVFHYDPGYPVGTIIRLLGNLSADAFGHTGIGSAESFASAGGRFELFVIPLAGTAPFATLALVLAVVLRRRPSRPAVPTA